MMHKKRLFSDCFKKRKIVLGVFCALSVLATPGFGADNGCSTDTNDRINPELAMCSVHVYNIGGIENPRDAAEKQMMNDVVALKATIMAQQMKKQYDYLEVTIQRFKTQLKKAILTTSMEAAGASSESGSGASSKTVGAGILTGTYDCNRESSTSSTLDCLARNLGIARNEIDTGRNTGQVRRQIEADLSVLKSIHGESNLFDGSKPAGLCAKYNLNKTDTQNCLNAMNRDIITAKENLNKSNARGMGIMGGLYQ